MKYALILLILLVFGSAFFIFVGKKQSTQRDTSPTLTITITPVPQESACRNKIISDNGLYEDRYAKAVKTCKETQICTYEDFRMYSKANGNYVPDWRSDEYMRLEVTKCLETIPTEALSTPSSASSSSDVINSL